MRRVLSPKKRSRPGRGAVVAIVPAAGSGKRMALKTEKPFVMLAGRPLVWYALNALERSACIDSIIVASSGTSVARLRKLVKKSGFRKVAAIIEGGRERVDSVRNCLARIDDRCEIVLIHDGARPLIDGKTIRDSVRLARRYGACVVAAAHTDTVKLVDGRLFIKGTLDRNLVYRAQTPQVFRRRLIEKAYQTGCGEHVTDDASLVEKMGRRVKILTGPTRNIKITTRQDLRLAEALL